MGEFLVSGYGMVTLGMGGVLETCIAKTRRCVCRYVRGCQHLSKHHVSSGMVVLLGMTQDWLNVPAGSHMKPPFTE